MDEVQQQGAKLAQLAAELPTVAAAGDAHALHTEVESLRTTHVLAAHGKFALIWFQKNEAPQLFHELARMREITFRASGQGGGSSVDITREDDYYHQLVLWDYEQKRLVGAYRLGITQEVLQQHGQQALYLDHVFHLHPDFFDQIGAAVELTRSFIHPDYQKDPLALSHLWRGLGSVCAKRGIRTLFGSVTIPATVSDASRAVIVEYLRRYHSAEPLMLDLVQARVPFQAPGAAHRLIVDAHVGEPIEVLRDCVLALDGTVCPIPPLIRHYLSMNAKFLGFHVEQEFGNALYCLLHVDLEKAPAAHLKRFLGRAAG
jgi:putative hemolysin